MADVHITRQMSWLYSTHLLYIKYVWSALDLPAASATTAGPAPATPPACSGATATTAGHSFFYVSTCRRVEVEIFGWVELWKFSDGWKFLGGRRPLLFNHSILGKKHFSLPWKAKFCLALNCCIIFVFLSKLFFNIL